MSFLVFNLTLIGMGLLGFLLEKIPYRFFAVANALYALYLFARKPFFNLVLLGRHGVHLVLDDLSTCFLLLTAVVFLAVYTTEMEGHLPQLLAVTLGVLNLMFVSNDLFNIYVILEILSILSALLVIEGRKLVQYWSALKYIVLSSVGMNLYLIGTAIIYSNNATLSISQVEKVNQIAVGLILAGVLVRTGVFLFGVWLPDVYSEAETAVSAVLSGVMAKTGVYALLRLWPLFDWNVLKPFALLSIPMGALLAFFSRDYKRILAYSSISHLGAILISPISAPIYSLSHAVSKSWLFLLKEELPDRDVSNWRELSFSRWFPLILASLSIMGLPGLAGSAKTLVLENLGDFEKFFLEASFAVSVAPFWRFLFKTPVRREKLTLKTRDIFLLATSLAVGITFFKAEKVLENLLVILAGLPIFLIFDRYRIECRFIEKLDVSLSLYSALVVIACLCSLLY